MSHAVKVEPTHIFRPQAITQTADIKSDRHARPVQIPIASAAPPGAPLTAISCLGAFQTPAASVPGSAGHAGVRKPAQFRT